MENQSFMKIQISTTFFSPKVSHNIDMYIKQN